MMMMMMMVVAVTVMMMIAWPQHSATRPALVRKPLEEPFHLPTIWQPHRGMKHVCVAECPRPMPVIHLEVGQQAVRSREWFDNNRLKALKWYPASARWRAWTSCRVSRPLPARCGALLSIPLGVSAPRHRDVEPRPPWCPFLSQ